MSLILNQFLLLSAEYYKTIFRHVWTLHLSKLLLVVDASIDLELIILFIIDFLKQCTRAVQI